jgi:hypothetical protein
MSHPLRASDDDITRQIEEEAVLNYASTHCQFLGQALRIRNRAKVAVEDYVALISVGFAPIVCLPHSDGGAQSRQVASL